MFLSNQMKAFCSEEEIEREFVEMMKPWQGLVLYVLSWNKFAYKIEI